MRAGLFHRAGHGHDLLLALHRAGARDDAEVAAADLDAAHVDDRVLRMKAPVAAFKGLADAGHVFHDVQRGDQFRIHLAGVADEPQHRLVFSLGYVYADAHLLEPVDELRLLLLSRSLL